MVRKDERKSTVQYIEFWRIHTLVYANVVDTSHLSDFLACAIIPNI